MNDRLLFQNQSGENMPIVTKLTKIGTDYAITIDTPVMEILGIQPDSKIEITTDGKSLFLTPVQQNAETAEGAKIKEETQDILDLNSEASEELEE